jgi:hypothetical protein
VVIPPSAVPFAPAELPDETPLVDPVVATDPLDTDEPLDVEIALPVLAVPPDAPEFEVTAELPEPAEPPPEPLLPFVAGVGVEKPQATSARAPQAIDHPERALRLPNTFRITMYLPHDAHLEVAPHSTNDHQSSVTQPPKTIVSDATTHPTRNAASRRQWGTGQCKCKNPLRRS